MALPIKRSCLDIHPAHRFEDISTGCEEIIDGHIAHIVAGSGILRAGVAQAHDKPVCLQIIRIEPRLRLFSCAKDPREKIS